MQILALLALAFVLGLMTSTPEQREEARLRMRTVGRWVALPGIILLILMFWPNPNAPHY